MKIWFFVQGLIAVLAIAYAYYAWRTKVPLVFTQRAARNVILGLVREEMAARPGQKLKIYDLGAGLGGLCLVLAREFPDAEIVGLEMGWPIWAFAVLRGFLSLRKNVRFLQCDFWKHNISDGDIVLCYLGDVVMADLRDKLRRESRKGRLFISNTFPLPADWPPEQRIPIAAVLSKEILVYRQ
jgi:SAM-dependent methyltransferase